MKWKDRFARLAVALAILLAAALPASAQSSRTDIAASRRVETAPEAFWEALRLDDVKGLQTQMLRGAGANASHPELGPALVAAARERSPKVLAYLAKLPGTRIDAANKNNETALMLSALLGDLDSVKLLVERGAQVNRVGWTPLHYAASSGHLLTIEYLLDQNAYIDAESPNRTTPLMMAARHEHTNAVHKLIDAGADPTLRNEAGYTAADYLAAHGEKAEASWLRERAAEFAERYRRGSTAGSEPGATPRNGTKTNAAQTNGAKADGRPADRGEVRTTPVAPPPRLPGSRD